MSKKRIVKVTTLIIVTVGFAWRGLSYKDAIDELMRSESDKAVLEKDIEELRKEANNNREYLEKLRKDPDFQDATARQELGYGKDGERVYRFPEEK